MIGNTLANTSILIDEIDGMFVALPDTSDSFFGDAKVVTSIDQIKDKNPDVILFNQVAGVDVNVTVTSREEKQTVDGNQVSYNPRYGGRNQKRFGKPVETKRESA